MSTPWLPDEVRDADPDGADRDLTALIARRRGARWTNLGFPAATDISYTRLAPALELMLNNLGDPMVDGAYPIHCKEQERFVVDVLSSLFRLPADDRWGYVASGATEATIYALHLARTVHPDPVVYHSSAAHHSITDTIRLLGLPSVIVGVDEYGSIAYANLAAELRQRPHRPAIVIANIGAAGTEAIDDITAITAVLRDSPVDRFWVHADAALSGIPLALIPRAVRPAGIDFAAGAHSLVASGHKFFGTPVPCAVVLVRASHHGVHADTLTYTGSPHTTVANSRSGLAVLALWYAIRCVGLDGMRERAEHSRDLAAYAYHRLRELGVAARHLPWAFTVDMPELPAAVTTTWNLALDHGRRHLVCMPGVTRAQIDAFLTDLTAALHHPAPDLPTPGATDPLAATDAPLLRAAVPALLQALQRRVPRQGQPTWPHPATRAHTLVPRHQTKATR